MKEYRVIQPGAPGVVEEMLNKYAKLGYILKAVIPPMTQRDTVTLIMERKATPETFEEIRRRTMAEAARR